MNRRKADCPVKVEPEIGVMLPQKLGSPEARKGHGFSLTTFKRNHSCWQLDFEFLVSRIVRQ